MYTVKFSVKCVISGLWKNQKLVNQENSFLISERDIIHNDR